VLLPGYSGRRGRGSYFGWEKKAGNFFLFHKFLRFFEKPEKLIWKENLFDRKEGVLIVRF